MVLDVYFWRSKAPRDPLDALLFAGFFPTIMSGPIERAAHFLPQLAAARKWNTHRFAEGVWLIAIGAFQKAVIADNIGSVVDGLLNKPDSGSAVVLGLFAYAIQIFGDFAGYSDMARGVARLLGFDITQNFLAPYGSPNISEFWKRWHISLSSWLNDYVFSSCSMALREWGIRGMIAATWVTFLVSGLWHGTGWNYVVWGSVHAIGLTAFAVTKDLRKKAKKRWEKSWWLVPLAVSITFWWVCLGYLFFRAPGLPQALEQLGLVASRRWAWPVSTGDFAVVASCTAAVFYLHKAVYRGKDVFWIFKKPIWFRCGFYLALGLLLLRFHAPSERFIYFQF
jgi:D-alanyl-lipoteichoic acid acyltransferase DltB (MBOAT superfamily)